MIIISEDGSKIVNFDNVICIIKEFSEIENKFVFIAKTNQGDITLGKFINEANLDKAQAAFYEQYINELKFKQCQINIENNYNNYLDKNIYNEFSIFYVGEYTVLENN